MPVPALQRTGASDARRLGSYVDAAVGHHRGEAREAVEAVGVDAVARGLCKEPGAERGALALESKVQHSSVESVVEVGVGDSRHGVQSIVAS